MTERLIVVGVDASDRARSALRWAVDEARLRGATVHVVHAYWAAPLLAGDTLDVTTSPIDVLRRYIDETVGDEPGIRIAAIAIQGRQASAALLDEARDAELLVVGSRGEGGFVGLLLGSVSEQCVHHARCPVVVVRP